MSKAPWDDLQHCSETVPAPSKHQPLTHCRQPVGHHNRNCVPCTSFRHSCSYISADYRPCFYEYPGWQGRGCGAHRNSIAARYTGTLVTVEGTMRWEGLSGREASCSEWQQKYYIRICRRGKSLIETRFANADALFLKIDKSSNNNLFVLLKFILLLGYSLQGG